ncbi:MAG: gp436 family protein [Paracoccaceae bacterium]
MSYATQQDLIDRYGEARLIALTDRADVPTGAVDVDTVTAALDGADAIINGYVGVRYALPLSEVPPLVNELAQVIAWWKLHLFEPDAKTTEEYKDALRTLRDISSGAVRLPNVAGAEPDDAGTGGVQITDRERPFTEANMKGFI